MAHTCHWLVRVLFLVSLVAASTRAAAQSVELQVRGSTFLGGLSFDSIAGMTVDRDGNLFVVGSTHSADFPIAGSQHGPGPTLAEGEAFVTKIDGRSGAIVYSVFVGGTGLDIASRIAVDDDGAAYVAGNTFSGDFPRTTAPVGAPADGLTSGFLIKLGPSGELLFSTTIGGSTGQDYAFGVAVGCGGIGYVAGTARSSDFPAGNRNSVDFTGNMSYVMAFDPDRMALDAPALVGDGEVADLTCDADSHAILTGYTVKGLAGIDGRRGPGNQPDGFMAKVDRAGHVVFGAYLPGEGYDPGRGIAVGRDGHIVVVGTTDSVDFPVTSGGSRHLARNSFDVFVTKFTSSGEVVYSTVLPSLAVEEPWSVAVDPSNRAWLAGYNSNGAFAAVVDESGRLVGRRQFQDGRQTDQAFAVAVSNAGDVYAAGTTASPRFPVAPDAAQKVHGGDVDGIIVRLSIGIARLHVETPNRVARWGIGTRQRVAWVYSGEAAQFRIDISRDGGVSWRRIATVPNLPGRSQNFYWTVGGTVTQTGRIRVTAVGDATATDTNDSDIHVAAAFIRVIHPTSRAAIRSGDTVRIFWQHNLGARVPVAIDVSFDGGATWEPVTEVARTSGAATSSYLWPTPAVASAGARLRIRALDGTSAMGISAPFALNAGVSLSGPATLGQ